MSLNGGWKEVKICAQKVGSENYFKNQVGKITHSVNTNKTLSVVTPIITLWPYEPRGHGREEYCAHIQKHQLSLNHSRPS